MFDAGGQEDGRGTDDAEIELDSSIMLTEVPPPTNAPTSEQFIGPYTRYNVVCNQTFVQQLDQDTLVPGSSVAGYGRDDPTPFMFTCANPGYTVTSLYKHVVAIHARTCTPKKTASLNDTVTQLDAVAPDDPRHCQWFDDSVQCEWLSAATTEKTIRESVARHKRSAHLTSPFQPVGCPEVGCDSTATMPLVVTTVKSTVDWEAYTGAENKREVDQGIRTVARTITLSPSQASADAACVKRAIVT
ncbi:hypothetical protein LTR97_004542 [Elasticomyces elasticus]|uniref:Uncharacterized protein n=1 Tax=Elasticomyces elasticus TaxID=574655 RepID=A0AAN7WD83_9PEZI|nr:hypothetical protein LTR97_004542 [Elasticomyces elasticus]